MSEQYSLFQIPTTKDNLFNILSDIVEKRRDKYDYHKMHISGMYEMIKNAPESELYDIIDLTKSKNGDINFYFDSQLYIKILMKKERLNLSKELYDEIIPNTTFEPLTGSSAPKGGVSVSLCMSDISDIFTKCVEYLIRVKKPSNKFGCCSQYNVCSQKGQCVHEYPFYAKGCSYRDNLENGQIFYNK